MKRVHGDEAPVIKNLQKMKTEKEELAPEERARIKEEMRAMIQRMKERMGDRLIINPTGQRALLKILKERLQRESDQA